jgi:hypothetical protein
MSNRSGKKANQQTGNRRNQKGAEHRDHTEAPTGDSPTSSRSDYLHPKNHCEATCKTEKDWWDRMKPFVEIAGGLFLLVYTIFTIFMWSANSKAANAAKEASETAARQLEISERPWIRFRSSEKYDTPIQISAGQGLDVPGQFINTGKTPALHVRATVFVQIVGPGNDADLPGKNQPIPEPGKPFPKGGYHDQLIPPQFDWSPALYPDLALRMRTPYASGLRGF